jgi:glycosyltransferase involved in cell wall biosynthesis
VADLTALGIAAKTTIIGLGKEEAALKAQAAAAGVAKLVEFPGPQQGEALARLLNRHRILVIPSRCEEAFGIVALEALASGCVVVAADSGALPEVVGPCGLIFPKDDKDALVAALKKLLLDSNEIDALRRHVPAQLARFRDTAVLDACEAVISDTVGSPPTGEARLAGNR